MYEVLGLAKGASMDEVKKAYKRLALLHHPDKGGNVEEFRKITDAYEKITNPDPTPVPNQQHVQVVNLSLAEVVLGALKIIKINRKSPCNSCKSPCNHCGGSGVIVQQIMMFTMQNACPACNGNGSMSNGCTNCNFKKYTETCELLNLNISPGIQECNIQNESIILVIKIDSHPEFTRLAPTQVLWCPKISFEDSVKGSKLKCPFFNGDFEVDTSSLVPIDPRVEYQSSNIHVKIKYDIQYPQ